MSRETYHPRLSKVTLAVGFLALLLGTLTAFRDPATGYELSIYAATPVAFWVGVALAIAASLAVSFGERRSQLVRDGAQILGVTTISTIVALPLVRGYYHFGGGDSLTHLGWTKDIVAGRLDPVNMLYPGVHTTTIFVSNVLGTSYSASQLLVTLAFFLVFVAFVTMCIRMLGQAEWALPVGLFSALLILPNNNVSVHLMAHPITQSLFLLPIVFYLLLKYVGRTGESTNTFYVATPVGVLLAVTSMALVLVHPQGALNVVVILLAIAGVQFFFRRFRSNGTIESHRPVYVPALVATAAFAVWAPRHERVRRTVETVFDGLVMGRVPADEITQRSASLTELGASLTGLFTKLFLVAAIFCLLAGALVALWYAGRLDDRYQERNALLTYLIVALVPLTLAFGVFFASSMTTQHFRYVGFIMVPITILGGVAISEGTRYFRTRISDQTIRASLVVCFFLCMALPIATIHASPFIYQPTQGVTEQEFQGTQAAVERMDRDIAFAGVRGGPDRLLDGTYGTVGADEMGFRGTGSRGNIPGEVFDRNLTTHYEDRRYVPVTDSDVQREVRLYDGFRYSERGFERLDSSPAIDRVQSNGEYQLYLLQNESAS